MPGWPEMRFYGPAKTDGGGVWWWEERQPGGFIKRNPLMPYNPVARSGIPGQQTP